jgi:hypothetical protein
MVDNGHIFCIICMYVLILYQTDCRYGVIITRHLKKPGCDAQGVPATLQIHTHTQKHRHCTCISHMGDMLPSGI